MRKSIARVFVMVTLLALFLVGLSSAVGAQQYPPDVRGRRFEDTTPAPHVAPNIVEVHPGGLAVTGRDVLVFAVAGLGLVGAGFAIKRIAHREPHAPIPDA